MPERQVTAKIALYRITRCGFQTRKRIVPQSFANPVEVFADLTQWVGGATSVFNTSTFTPAEDSDEYPVYCHDIYRRGATGSVGLVLWNKTNIGNGPLTAIRASEPCGSAPVEIAEQDDDLIHGIPSYFWLSPERNVCATIRMDTTFSGVGAFSKYVYSFMANHSCWRIEIGDDVHYWNDGLGARSAIYRPHFTVKRKRNPAEVRAIIANRSNIRKVICKDVLARADAMKETVWQQLLGFLRAGTPRTLPYDVPVKSEMSFCPTEDELHSIIRHGDQQFSHDSDIGFQFVGQQGVYWLSGIFDRREQQLTLASNAENVSVYTAESLVHAVDAYLLRGVV